MRKSAIILALVAMLAPPAFAANRRINDGAPITGRGDESVISRFVRIISHILEVGPDGLPIIPHP